MNTNNLSKHKVVSDDPAKKIADLLFWGNQSVQELDWWFELRQKTSYPENLALRKPICIEIYEFAHYLAWTIKQIDDVVENINKWYLQRGRGNVMQHLDRKYRKIVNGYKNNLEKPRNLIAAHRYTTKSKDFITSKDVMSASKELDWKVLEKSYKEIKAVYNDLNKWYKDPKHRNNLVLSDIAKNCAKINCKI